MDKEISRMLDEEIKASIEKLSTLQKGSKEETAVIDNLEKLYKLRIEETKVEYDFEEKREKRTDESNHADDDIWVRKLECELEEKRIRSDVIDRVVRGVIAVSEIVLPLSFYALWMERGFQFEEKGAITSFTFKDLIKKFKPTKK